MGVRDTLMLQQVPNFRIRTAEIQVIPLLFLSIPSLTPPTVHIQISVRPSHRLFSDTGKS